jgi:hypothetical protein
MCPRHHHLATYHGTVKASRPMLTDDALTSIRLAPETMSLQALADHYATTVTTVVAVRSGRNWGYIRS